MTRSPGLKQTTRSCPATMLLILFFLAIALIAPTRTTQAAGIVPECSSPTICEDANGHLVVAKNVCNACDIFKLVQNVLNYIWYRLTIPVAILMFIYAGFLMLVPGVGTGLIPGLGEKSAATYSKGKNVLKNTIVGIAIIFFAWLLIDTIIKVVGEGKFGPGTQFGPWNTINCTPPLPPSGSVPQCRGEGNYFDELGIPSGGGTPLTHEQALQELQSCCPGWSPIQVSSTNGCSARTGTGCTSLDQIRPETIQAVIDLKKGCSESAGRDCAVTITGGTELGHSTSGAISHAGGYKVDINPDSNLDAYIETKNSELTIPSRSDTLKEYLAPAGRTTYALECQKVNNQCVDANGNPTTDRSKFVPGHWDITVFPSS